MNNSSTNGTFSDFDESASILAIQFLANIGFCALGFTAIWYWMFNIGQNFLHFNAICSNNSFTIITIRSDKELRSKCYGLIVNLALADLCVGVVFMVSCRCKIHKTYRFFNGLYVSGDWHQTHLSHRNGDQRRKKVNYCARLKCFHCFSGKREKQTT